MEWLLENAVEHVLHQTIFNPGKPNPGTTFPRTAGNASRVRSTEYASTMAECTPDALRTGMPRPMHKRQHAISR